MKNPIILLMLIFSSQLTYAQGILTGKVVDENNSPLSGATLFIPEMNMGTVSDTEGHYRLSNLPIGKLQIQCSYVGFSRWIETIDLTGGDIELIIRLFKTTIEAEEIVVTGGYNSTQHTNAVKIEVFKLDPLENKGTANFTEILTRVPGVGMISKGSGVSKPVIRGLSMNDILVLSNGVRFENYQYSSHHPLGIDEFGIESIEIIKGPASLLYGSDAIGGVINFIKEKPAPVGTFAGDYNLQVFSNTLGINNNLGLKGSSEKFFGGIRIGHKTHADFTQGGGDFVPNTRFNEYSIKANAGHTGKIGTFKLFYDYNNQKLGLAEDEAIEEITVRGRANKIWFQEFNTHLISAQNKLYLGKFKLDINSAWQNTELVHFGEPDQYEIQMRLATLTYETRLHLPSGEDSEYILGYQGLNQTNTNLNNRESKLLPDANTGNHSLFGLFQYTFFSKLRLQAGIRYDNKSIITQVIGTPADTLDYRPSLEREFASFSGSFGATLNLSEELLFRANIASAFRTPNLAELTSNGQHELRFDKGDPTLVPEKSYEADLSMHYHLSNITFDVAGFYNRIDQYIFIAPTGTNTGSGVPVYHYRQANSFLFGGEAGLHLHPRPVEWLHFLATFSTVTGKQENGEFLPFIPANQLRFEIRAERENFLFLKKAFFSMENQTAFSQTNPSPEETSTSGYSLINLATGGNIKWKRQPVSFSISINNLFDIKYIDHLSTLKEVNFFNPGRNLSFSLRIPFTH
jgi:iron complex outermembrane recepter protein